MDNLEKMARATFEEWAKRLSLDISMEVNAWGDLIYKYPHIHTMWHAWKAALSAMEPAIRDAEQLREAISAVNVERIPLITQKAFCLGLSDTKEQYLKGLNFAICAMAPAMTKLERAAIDDAMKVWT